MTNGTKILKGNGNSTTFLLFLKFYKEKEDSYPYGDGTFQLLFDSTSFLSIFSPALSCIIVLYTWIFMFGEILLLSNVANWILIFALSYWSLDELTSAQRSLAVNEFHGSSLHQNTPSPVIIHNSHTMKITKHYPTQLIWLTDGKKLTHAY